MIEREVEIVFLILAEFEAFDEVISSFVQVVYVELPKVSPTIGKGLEVGSRRLPDKDGGHCLLLCYRFSGATK